MVDFFNRFLESIFEIFTHIFSFVPFQVFFLFGSVLAFTVFFIQLFSPRGSKE